jgi:hypothetical protein
VPDFAATGTSGSPDMGELVWSALVQQKRTQPLDGLGYRPLAVSGTKDEFLQWIGTAVKEREIEIPEEGNSIHWNSILTSPPD